jgi:hypothetical protein
MTSTRVILRTTARIDIRQSRVEPRPAPMSEATYLEPRSLLDVTHLQDSRQYPLQAGDALTRSVLKNSHSWDDYRCERSINRQK